MSAAPAAMSAAELAEASRELVSHGLCALPAIRAGDAKRPCVGAWTDFQRRLPTAAEIDRWFGAGSDANSVCLVCGTVSGNLEMIDFDLGAAAFPEWAEAVRKAAPGLLERLVVETSPSGGRHVVYRCEAPVGRNAKLAQRVIEAPDGAPLTVGSREHTPRLGADGRWTVVVTMIETRGEGGLFLCAPSPGYQVRQGDLRAPPTISAEERETLLAAAHALDEAPRPVVGQAATPARGDHTPRPGDEFNLRGDPRPILLRHGWTLARPEGADGNEHWTRPGKTGGTSATLKDRVLYVFSTNAPPFEAGKGYSPFAVHALLEHHGDFRASAAALRSQGFAPQTPPSGVDLSAFLPGQPASAPLAPAPVSVRDLVAAHPILRPPVIEGLLREGETMNVIASPKTGKSWLTLDLAIAIATGRSWLGRFATAAGDVLVVDNELHRETSAHRIPHVARARGIAMRDFDERIHVDNLRGRLMDIHSLAPYFEAVEPGRYKVVILDAFYRFLPAGGDENDNGTMAGIYNRIDGFADRLRSSFVLIHHSTKGSQSGKSVTDVGAGAGAQSRATDTHLVLRPHAEPGVAVLDGAVRSWKPIEPLCLRWTFPVWNPEHALDPSALKPERAPSPRKSAAAERDSAGWTPARFVGEFVGHHPQTLPELRKAAMGVPGLTWRVVPQLLAEADALGLVARVAMPGRGGPKGYTLPTTEAVP